MSHARVIGKNIRFIALSRMVSVVVSFLLLPFIIGHVGKEVYGVYLIVMTVTGYFGLLDLGVMSALTKYVSEYNGKSDLAGVNRIVNASFSLYVLIGFVISGLAFLCAVYFTRFFRVDPAHVTIMKDLFIAASVSSLLVWPMSVFRGTIQGLNLWGEDVAVSIISQIVIAASTVVILSKGWGIVPVFIFTQGAIVLANGVLHYLVRRRTGLRIIFPHTDMTTFRFIFNFSIYMFLGSLIMVFLYQVHNLIIGYFISMSALSIYAVAYNLQNYFRVINSSIGSPSWVVASQMEGEGDHARQKQLLFRGTKLMSAAFLPLIIIVFIFAEPFIIYWMGPAFRESILPARIIIIYWLFNGTMELAIGMLSAKGVVREPLVILSVAAGVNLLISLLFIQSLGLVAVALGLMVSMSFIAFPLYLRLALKTMQVTFFEYFEKSIRGNLGLYALTAGLGGALLICVPPTGLLGVLAEMGVVYVVVQALYYFYFLDAGEREDVRRMAGVLRVTGALTGGRS